MTSFVLLGKHSSLQHCILKKKDTPNYCKRWSRRKKWVGGMSSQRGRYSQCIHENLGEESILQEWIDMQFLHRKSRSLNFAVYRLRAKMCSFSYVRQAYFWATFLESYRVTWLRRVEFFWRNPWVFFAKPLSFFSNGLFYLKWMQYLLNMWSIL